MHDEQESVLIIDDEPLILETLQDYMEERGFNVWIASDGRQGLDLFVQEHQDLVLVDLRMPEIDGLKVMETIARNSPNTPVIVVSGTGIIQDAIDALRVGAWDFITKPFGNFDVFDHAVHKALERSRLIRENILYQEHLEDQVRLRTEELEGEIRERKKIENELRKSEHKFRELSIKDGLTGLYNARYFFRQIESEVERCSRYEHPLSLILMDIDDFKLFNDTYGHLQGDKVLACLAKTILKMIRRNDSAYRYGGEEFVVILPETSAEEAVAVAERIRQTFALENQCQGAVPPVFKTVSVGVAEYIGGEQTTQLIERADQKMYYAKTHGKNRVVW